MTSLSSLIRWKVLPVKRIAADKEIFPAAIPRRFGYEYHTISWFSAQSSATISILPKGTDLLIVAYAGHFKQYRNRGSKYDQNTRYLISSVWLLIGWSLVVCCDFLWSVGSTGIYEKIKPYFEIPFKIFRFKVVWADK